MESETRARLRRALTARPDSKWTVTYRDDLQCALDAFERTDAERDQFAELLWRAVETLHQLHACTDHAYDEFSATEGWHSRDLHEARQAAIGLLSEAYRALRITPAGVEEASS